MFRPDIPKMIPRDESIFSLAIAIAKRAKIINDEMEQEKLKAIEDNNGKLPNEFNDKDSFVNTKPVTLAMEEIDDGEVIFRSASSGRTIY